MYCIVRDIKLVVSWRKNIIRPNFRTVEKSWYPPSTQHFMGYTEPMSVSVNAADMNT